jgi:hypothetical protein
MTFIIESITSNINNMKVLTNNTGYSTQEMSTALTGIDGTEIEYTPTANCNSVVYECNYTIYWNPDPSSSYACIRLQESTDDGSTWTTISGSECLEGTFDETDYDAFCLHFKQKLTTWSSSKKLRLAGRAYHSTGRYTIGKGITAGNVITKSIPQVFVYEV